MAKSITQEQKDYIQQNCFTKSDTDIAAELGISTVRIATYRKKIGALKTKGFTKLDVNPEDLTASHSLTEQQRKQFFKTQLTNTLFYKTIKEQFTEDEIQFYLEEWGSLCVQFEDVLATEKRQIDELIKAQIMGNRILRNIKVAEEEKRLLIQDVHNHRLKHQDIVTNEEAQDRDTQLMNLVKIFSSQVAAMTQDYQKNVDLKNKMLDQLNARRRDRIDQIKRTGTTFIGLVEKFRERDVREKEGRHMELIRLAKEKKKSQWRKPIMFPDGQTDCVLLDEDSEIPEQELAVIDPNDSIIVTLANKVKKKVIILDRDTEKADLIKARFPDSQVDIVKSPNIAQPLIINGNFDLVFIGENYTVKPIIQPIINDDKTQRSCFILYASDQEFLDKTEKLFEDKRKVNKVIFEDLIKILEK